MAVQLFQHDPDYLVEPGSTLQETLDALDLTQADLAERTGFSRKHINQIIRGVAPISHEAALAFERVTGVPARFWDNLESNYRRRLLAKEEREQLADETEWVKSLPIPELVARGLIDDPHDRGELAQSLLRFFGVSNIRAWHAVWGRQRVALMRQTGRGDTDVGALAAWLREGELAARREDVVQPFDEQAFKSSFPMIKEATRNPRTAVQQTREICRSVGLVFVVVDTYDGCRASGAARWLTASKPMIQLSRRFRRDDHFWFSFFHEAGHIVLHSKKRSYIDDLTDSNDLSDQMDTFEREADDFATRALFTPQQLKQIERLESIAEVVRFAKRAGIAPGIVVGQIQRQRLDYKWGNQLRAEVRV